MTTPPISPLLPEDENDQLYEHLRIVVDKGQVPLRIDKYMTEKLQHSSRNRIQLRTRKRQTREE